MLGQDEADRADELGISEMSPALQSPMSPRWLRLHRHLWSAMHAFVPAPPSTSGLHGGTFLEIKKMGFTVYHQTRGVFPPAALDAFLKDASKLLASKRTPKVCFEYDQPNRPAHVGKDQIRFNGPGDSLGHETFLLELDNPGTANGFCKTNRKPYTAACLAVLILAKRHAPKWVTFSDDDNDTHTAAILEAKKLIAILDGKIPDADHSTISPLPMSGGILSW